MSILFELMPNADKKLLLQIFQINILRLIIHFFSVMQDSCASCRGHDQTYRVYLKLSVRYWYCYYYVYYYRQT